MEAARSFEMIGPKSYKVKNQLTPCHVHDKLLKMYVLKWLTPAQKLKRLNFEEEGKRVERLLEKGELKRIKEEFEAGIPPNELEVPGGGVGANDAMNELGLRAAFLRARTTWNVQRNISISNEETALLLQLEKMMLPITIPFPKSVALFVCNLKPRAYLPKKTFNAMTRTARKKKNKNKKKERRRR